MIKWKIKDEHKAERDEFYFAKDGFVIKIDKTPLDLQSSGTFHPIDIWKIEIYYYTNTVKSVIFNSEFYVDSTKEAKLCESIAKANATKMAKKFMAKYAHRANTFFGAIAS